MAGGQVRGGEPQRILRRDRATWSRVRHLDGRRRGGCRAERASNGSASSGCESLVDADRHSYYDTTGSGTL